MSKFISFYTPTYRRPTGLARCLASVQAQTVVDDIDQVVIVDHVGVGIHGMYGRVGDYASAMRGMYVHMLCDDDVLAGPHVVEQVRDAAVANNYPELIIVRAAKGGMGLPLDHDPWPPVCGRIDLGCFIVRNDIWQRHAKDYGARYEGDYDFAEALFKAGVTPFVLHELFVIGGVSRGAVEAA